MNQMTLANLLFTLLFVGIALGLSIYRKLGLNKDIVIASVRLTLQLLAVGYILRIIFGFHNLWTVILTVIAMMLSATQNSARRGRGISHIFYRVFVSIFVAELIVQGVLVGFRIVPATGQYVIPMSGMIVGNAMVVASLFLNRIVADTENRRDEIQTMLALGGSPKQAIWPILTGAVRASLIPTLDSTKTTGLVQLPGMMTGQIIAGADPIQAVRYQLIILLAIMASATITSVILSTLVYTKLFNRWQQIVDIPRAS